MSQAKPLSSEELKVIIPIVKEVLLSQKGYLYSTDLKHFVQTEIDKKFIPYRLAETRLRQMINYLRSNTILPIISDRRGYRVSNDKEDIIRVYLSLKERAESIMAAANGLIKFTI